MGGCLSVPWSWGQLVNQASQWLWSEGSYIRNLSENLESLEKTIEMLKANRDDVQRKVDREEFTGNQRRLEQVQVWLTNVLEIENQFNDLISTSELESQRLCLGGFCSQNIIASNIYGKRVMVMLREVENLGSQREFPVVADTVVPSGEEMPSPPTIVGQEEMFAMVWNRLMEDDVGIVGLYGMGGVGKTTILTKINNKLFKMYNRFYIVIWVTVSNGATIHKIQGDILIKLGLKGEEWDQKEQNERAIGIYNVLRRHRFVLLLDDIWDKVDLKAVGVPNPSRENKCKIAFTTRSRDVCGRMGVHQPIKVNCLDSKKAWKLFKKKVGVNTLKSHPDIPELAKKVAEKCRGLPLTLNVIGETMACKTTVQEWHRTIKDLTSSIADFPYIENDVLPILKCSFDGLRGEKVKSCFLYWSLFPEDYRIEKEKLIDYWVCEGFIDENEGREMALNRGYEILGTLVRACLLIDNIWTVSMHDVVREMALWIATDFGKNKDQCIVQAGVGLREVPKVKNCKDVRTMSLMGNDIETVIDSLDCPQLTTLFLQNNKRLAHISGEFFRFLTGLLVLDLSSNAKITELPEEISKLVSLRYLDLSGTLIERLPVGLQELKMLIHLNLDCTWRFRIFHGISKLSSLRTLRLKHSKMVLDISVMKELELLEHLEYITIDISPYLFKEQSLFEEPLLYDSSVWRYIEGVNIVKKYSERTLFLPAAMINLHEIFIVSCGAQDIKIKKPSRNKSLSSTCFSNLSTVSVNNCGRLKDLTWLMFAPNLTSLQLTFLSQLETIINEEKRVSVLEEEPCKIIPFRKLRDIYLDNLPKLKSIYWTSLPFRYLQSISISNCPNLRKLSLDSQSVEKIEEFWILLDDGEEWINKIEWEDEDTKQRFLPYIKNPYKRSSQ